MVSSQEIYDKVTTHYSAQASRTATGHYASAVAKAFGYSEEDLIKAPEGSSLGLSCGNPLALASITEGETVIDLGSGAGFDVFQAAEKVGGSGRVVGIDMNKEMLAKANAIKEKTDKTNVEFVEARITDMAILPSSMADCIMSNCVINLVPSTEKNLVFKEAFRLLKPGGRLAVSDILAKKPLPEKLRNDMAMYVGCVAGTSLVVEYEGWLWEAGFEDVLIEDIKGDLNVYLDTREDGSRKERCCGSVGGEGNGEYLYVSPEVSDLNEWAGKCLSLSEGP